MWHLPSRCGNSHEDGTEIECTTTLGFGLRDLLFFLGFAI